MAMSLFTEDMKRIHKERVRVDDNLLTGIGLRKGNTELEERWCVQQMLRRTTGDASGKSAAFPVDALGGNRAQRGGAPFATMTADGRGRPVSSLGTCLGMHFCIL